MSRQAASATRLAPVTAFRHLCRVVAGTALVCLMPDHADGQAIAVDRYQRLDQMHHTAWTAKDGLIGRPNTLAQTADGFLWIGTSDGLFRFDGVHFERYRPRQGALFAVAVTSLAAAPGGGLWVGHTRGGATYLSADGRATQYPPLDKMPVGTVRSIVVDRDGATWFATVGGLQRFADGKWERIGTSWNYPYLSAWKLFLERDGTLWVGAASPDRIVFLPRGGRHFVDAGVADGALGFAQLDDSVVAYSPLVDEVVNALRRHPDRGERLGVIARAPSDQLALDRDRGLWVSGVGLERLRLAGNDRGTLRNGSRTNGSRSRKA